MSSDAAANRENARNRSNGQFGSQHRDEPGSLLVGDPEELIYGYTPEDLLHECERAARYRLSTGPGALQSTTGGPIDVDEVAGELVVRVLKARAAGREIEGLRGYLSTVAGRVVTDAWNPMSGTDRKAMGIFSQACTNAEDAKGRRLSGDERRELAEMIRDQWPNQRLRPSKSFLDVAAINRTKIYVANTKDDFVSVPDLDELLEAQAAPSPVFARGAGSWVDQASDLHENEARSITRVRRLMWNVAAESNDLPYVRPGVLSQQRITEYRSVLKSEADIVNAVAAWEAGESTPAVTALFAPFGDIDERDRRKVAASLRGPMRGRAHDMWISALDFTNTRFAGESQAAWDAFEASQGA